MNSLVTALVVLGSLTCKVCVMDLEQYFRRTKRVKLEVCVNTTGNFIADQSLIRYHSGAVKRKEITVCEGQYYFPKYPVVILKNRTDSIVLNYDSLFPGGELNKKFLDQHIKRLRTDN